MVAATPGNVDVLEVSPSETSTVELENAKTPLTFFCLFILYSSEDSRWPGERSLCFEFRLAGLSCSDSTWTLWWSLEFNKTVSSSHCRAIMDSRQKFQAWLHLGEVTILDTVLEPDLVDVVIVVGPFGIVIVEYFCSRCSIRMIFLLFSIRIYFGFAHGR